jgi:hypothetical protein
MKILGYIIGITLGAIGGVILYRALFVLPPSGYVVTESHVREIPKTAHLIGGFALLIIGAAVAFFSLRSNGR